MMSVVANKFAGTLVSISLSFVIIMTAVTAEPHFKPTIPMRRELTDVNEHEIKREMWEAYGSTTGGGTGGGDLRECSLIKLEFHPGTLTTYESDLTAAGSKFGASHPVYEDSSLRGYNNYKNNDEPELAGYFSESYSVTTLPDRVACLGSGVYTLYGDNQIFLSGVCGSKFNPITSGSGKYACATGVETFECDSTTCHILLYVCGNGCERASKPW